MAFSICTILVIWEVLSIIVGNDVKLPSPVDTVRALYMIITDEMFFISISNTMLRVVKSFSISFVIAVILGILSGFFNPVYYLLKPILLVQRSIPTMAVILLSLIWLNREISPILVGSLIVFPVLYASVVSSIRQVDKKLIEMVTVYKLDIKRKIRYLYIPSIKESLITISAVAVSLCIKVTIAAEVLSQPRYSIGTSFQLEKASINTAGVFAWAIIAILIASLFEYIIGMKWLKQKNKLK